MTALVLAPLAVSAVFLLPPIWFALLFWMVAALAAYEWAGLCGITRPWGKLLYVGLFGVCAFALYGRVPLYLWVLAGSCAVWVVAAAAVLAYPKFSAVFRQPLVVGLLGLWLALAAWLALVVIRDLPQGSYWLLWMFFLAWGADIGAYFAGKAYGKTVLAPAVSPAKTWEGAVGGFLLAGIVCGGAVWFWQPQPGIWLLVTFLLIVVSVFGDLFESLLKRATGIKDSGTILPGHGGMLDRIDSLLAVAPFLAVLHLAGPFS